jgi:hypothetical protein
MIRFSPIGLIRPICPIRPIRGRTGRAGGQNLLLRGMLRIVRPFAFPTRRPVMRRAVLLASVASLAVVVGVLVLLRPTPSAAEQKDEAAAHLEQLPIGQVVLFSSGVGYFQREGTVEGSTRVDLSFPVSDINDLLKSMVARDLDGGAITTISYESNAPVERTLKSFAINLNNNPSFENILNQTRGEKVEVVLQQANANQPGTLNGTVVGTEKQKIPAGKDSIEVGVLNLWCADGMRSVKLNEVQRIRFLNPVLDGEFKKALETLAISHDTQKKAVSLSFVGDGKRRVRVGYVIQNPIWKTSYRLVLHKEDKPYLQGWAVVDNPSDEDWKDVRMALVSGRPISFKMDLYTPLFVPRPTVEPELFASLRPQTYSGNMGKDEATAREMKPGRPLDDSKLGGVQGREIERLKRLAESGAIDSDLFEQALRARMNLHQGVASAASAARLGDFFQYAIDKPVTLPRQKSALLPIVAKDIDARRVSIYNESVQARFPLLGLEVTNTSGLHLMQGPITVFEGSNYAGDARILDLQPGEKRLLSYAIDLGTEVDPKPHNDNGKLTQVKIVRGMVEATTKQRESKTYLIKNRNDKERTVLIEHPVRNDFKLVDTEKPAEIARNFYRFQVNVPAGKNRPLTVTEERYLRSSVALTNSDNDQIRLLLKSTVSSEKVKEALKQALTLREALAKTQRAMGEQQRQLKTITDDQVRLRANLREMPQTAAAYKRYLKKFDDQETDIENLQKEIKKLQGVEHRQHKELDDYLARLNVE